ncbi:MAG TPA: hypothetical protein DHW02_09260, partial [Ktedonobacter sp.]|nr:hypothetical protein [Ktedonobacter sp.]
DHAGRLIEAAGLKGVKRGGAQISERHANFIVNVGGASAADIAALIQLAHTRVREQFGVDLELEVELRGEWGTGKTGETGRNVESGENQEIRGRETGHDER